MQTHLEWLCAKLKEYEEFSDSNHFGVEYPDIWNEQDVQYLAEKDAFASLTNELIAWLNKD